MESRPPAPSPKNTPDNPTKPSQRPLYSTKLGEHKNSQANPPRQTPAVQQKAWTGKNPITARASSQQNGLAQTSPTSQTNKQSAINTLREGQRVRITLNTGAEFEGTFAGASELSCNLRMVQQKKVPGGNSTNGAKSTETMTFQRKDIVSATVTGGNQKTDMKSSNGRPGFRTDAAISNSRSGSERVLKRWEPDSNDHADMSLESSSQSGPWDQFAENERRFGLKTDYDESIYTTAIDKNHPQYKQRLAEAEKKAREIEKTAPVTSHVAEERVMDFVGGDDKGGDEEDKYSGVKRQDFPPLTRSENSGKYMPPARRAPTGQATVPGAPVDPAIISSQIKGHGKKQAASKTEEAKPPAAAVPKAPSPIPDAKNSEVKATTPKAEPKSSDAKTPTEPTKPVDKAAVPIRPSAATAKAGSTQAKEGAPSATSTVERDVLNSFKSFAVNQRLNIERAKHNKAKHDKEIKLIELKKFADSFKLSTPVPSDLISIIAKDPAKQKQIQAKALQNAQEVQKAKEAAKEKEAVATKETPSKATPAEQTPVTQTEARPNARAPTAPQPAPQTNTPARHQNNRQTYAPGYHNPNFRNNQSPMGQQQRQPGLAARIRNNAEQQKNNPSGHHHQPGHLSMQDMRAPPTGPANNVDPPYRRLSGAPAHMNKLNPNSHEFRPNPYANTFSPNPAQPSAGSSPRSSVNQMGEPQSAPGNPLARGILVRRKTKAIDIKKCLILSHVKTFQPPPTKNWDENGGLFPSFDTPPTWRQLKNEEPEDSTMNLTYPQFFEKQPFSGAAMATPNPSHVMPQMAHQHQLPFHLQHGAHMAPRQSPHMPPMQMHTGQHGHAPHAPFNNGDDHRMMPSNSAQSYQSPRMSNVPMAYPTAMSSPAQMPYNQPVMQPYMGPGGPQMGSQYRNFSGNPGFMPQQPHMGGPVMMQPGFVPGPQGVPSMPMYPGAHPPFMQPAGVPPQPMPGSNGFPSPGRPAAPMMAPGGSQQGQPMYGMSPGPQYQQPAFPPQQPGQSKFPKNGPPPQMRKY